jgi:hypothetical protein
MQPLMTKVSDELGPHPDLSLYPVGPNRQHFKADDGVKDNLFLKDATQPTNKRGIE